MPAMNVSPEAKNYIAMIISDDTSDEMSQLPSSAASIGQLAQEKSVNLKRMGFGDDEMDKKRWSLKSSDSSVYTGLNKVGNSSSPSQSEKRLSMMIKESNGEHGKILIPSLKRSSTGSSLRKLFHNVSIEDMSQSKEGNKENLYGDSYRNLNSKGLDKKTRSFANSISSKVTRLPLGPVHNNKKTMSPSRCERPLSELHGRTRVTADNNWKFWKRRSTTFTAITPNTIVGRSERDVEVENLPPLRPKSSLKNIFGASSAGCQTIKHSPSTSNSLFKGLKHKTSHSSLQNFKMKRSANDTGIDREHEASGKPQISLPIPDKLSRDKIKSTLQNSTSLMSLHSYISDTVMIENGNKTLVSDILSNCTIKNILNRSDFTEDNRNTLYRIPQNNEQLSERVCRYYDTYANQTTICKKVPLSFISDSLYSNDMHLKEIIALNHSIHTMGFPNLIQSYILNEDVNDSDTLYLYLFMKEGGTPLHNYKMKNWFEASSIFWQIVTALYVMETKHFFEHRNLTHDHILIDKDSTVTICSFKASRYQLNPNSQPLFTRLDHPIFFKVDDIAVFKVYSKMRTMLNNQNHWKMYEPKTNVLWLKYLISELLNSGVQQQLEGPERATLVQLNKVLSIENDFDSYPQINSAGDLLRYKQTAL